jgi:hypothetical protein
MKKLLLLAALQAFPIFFYAQSYNTAGGIRLGTDWGLTFQQRIAKKTTLEAVLQKGFVQDEILLTLLGEQHFPILSRRLNLYFGGGVHAGWSSAAFRSGGYKNPIGITGIGGLEFSIGRLNLSWDFKPVYNLVGGESEFYLHSGLSARYIFVKREAMKKWFEQGKWKFWKKKDKRNTKK